MRHDIIHSLPFHIFALELDGATQYWIHRFKNEDDYRKDLRTYSEQSKNIDPGSIRKGLLSFLENEGYINIAELVTEEYKATIISTRSRMIQKDD